MATLAEAFPVATLDIPSSVETTPPDEEVARRVLKIRASWDLNERLRRREMAEERFEALLEALQCDTDAA